MGNLNLVEMLASFAIGYLFGMTLVIAALGERRW